MAPHRARRAALVILLAGCGSGPADPPGAPRDAAIRAVDASPAEPALGGDTAVDGGAPGDAGPAVDAAVPADAAVLDPVSDPAEALAVRRRLFGGRVVVAAEVQLEPDAWEALAAEPRRYAAARLVLDGHVHPRVGVRMKGGRGSFRRLPHKSALKIDLARYQSGRRHAGLRYLTLNNMVQDATLMRERLAYLAFERLGLPAPRAGYVELRLDGDPYGLYSHVETPDARLLEDRFPGDGHGNLYEGADDQDLWPRYLEAFDQDAGRDRSREDLRRLFAALDAATPWTFDEAVGSVVDLHQMRRFFAAEMLIGHWDGYAQLRNNYHLYARPSDGRFVFLPWGTDQAFQRTRNAFGGPGRLFRMCVDWIPCRLPYAETLRSMAAEMATWDWEAEIAALEALTAEPYARERKNPTRPEQRTAALEALRAFVREQPDRLVATLTCLDPALDRDGDGTLPCARDCDDADPTRHPQAVEVCGDGVDQDCSGFADDGEACPPCLEDGRPDGDRFFYCHRLERWSVARDACRAMGAELASIRDPGEQDRVATAALARNRGRWWIGLSDAGSEGEPRWTDATPLDFTAWAPGEPNDHGGYEDCACLGGPAGPAWNDVYCGLYLPYICRGPR